MYEHALYVRRAIELAANVPDYPFGALIVDRINGEISAEGWNKSAINPTLHGEMDAINQLVHSHPRVEGLSRESNDAPHCMTKLFQRRSGNSHGFEKLENRGGCCQHPL